MKKVYLGIFIIFFIILCNINVVEANSLLSNSSKSIKVKTKLYKTVESYAGSGYTNVQGFCTDGKYYYVAAVTKASEAGANYENQKSVLVKIDMDTNKVVKTMFLGNIGHCNSLTYNVDTDKIIIAPCSKSFKYLYIVDSELSNKAKKYLKNEDGKKIKTKISSMTYSPGRKEYIVKKSKSKLNIYDKNFVRKRTITLNETLSPSGYTNQSLYADSCYIYFISYNPKTSPYKNTIRMFDYNGNYVNSISLSNSINGEIEAMCAYGGKYYIMANVKINHLNKFKICRLKFRDKNQYDVAFVDFRNSTKAQDIANKNSVNNKYQTITYGEKQPIISTGFEVEGKTLLGYRAYKDKTNSWRVLVDGESSWKTVKEMEKLQNEGHDVKYYVYKTGQDIYKTTRGGNSVLMVATWE